MKTKLTIALLFLAGFVCAEESDTKKSNFEGSFSTDLVSQYIWRGDNCGDLSLQPSLGVSWKGLSLSAWGNVGISNFKDTKEIDLTLSYTFSNFNVGITDYWFSTGKNPSGKYFNYLAHETNHVFEANIGYDFGFLNVQWFTNFAGNDGTNKSGKRAYSSYLELTAPFRFVKLDWEAGVGIVPYATTYYKNDTFNVTNVNLKATKTFHIKNKISIPVYANVIANPCNGRAYFVVGAKFNLKL